MVPGWKYLSTYLGSSLRTSNADTNMPGEDPLGYAASSLKAGKLVTTGQSFTIMLVGETGTGKTSFLSLLANVLAGKSPGKYTLEPHDKSNEHGGGQKNSQTKTAKVYQLKSLNDVSVIVLDTPGLADTHGLQMDEEHKDSIACTIRDNIPIVTAVIIVANGTQPRLTVATDYTISTLCSIFPRTLAQNIGVLFTNVRNMERCNFEMNSFPPELQEAKNFCIDNPFALYKNAQRNRGRDQSKKKKLSENSFKEDHEMAVDTVAEIFDWLDGLESQATTEITSLYDISREIERKINDAFACMTQHAKAVDELKKLEKDSDGTGLTDSGAAEFKRVIQRGIWILKKSDTHNTVCDVPLCYTNCHEKCSNGFNLGPWKLLECTKFNRDTCTVCRHSITRHLHDKVIWYEEKRDYINNKIKVSIADVQKTIETYNKEIEQATEEIGRLTKEYSGLSLSGSFSSQVGKSVDLFETHLQSIRNTSDPQSVRRVKEGLDQLKKKFSLLKDVAEAAGKKVYHPTIVD